MIIRIPFTISVMKYQQWYGDYGQLLVTQCNRSFTKTGPVYSGRKSHSTRSDNLWILSVLQLKCLETLSNYRCYINKLIYLVNVCTTWLMEARHVSLSVPASLVSRLDHSSLSGLDDLLNWVFSMKFNIPSALYGWIDINIQSDKQWKN